MSTSDESKEYAQYLEALKKDHLAFKELCAELDAIALAEEDMEAAFQRAEKHLEQGTEDGFEAALDEIRPLFDHVDIDQIESQ